MATPAKPDQELLPEGRRPEKLTTGALRRARELRLWAGEGSGAPCDLCRVRIATSDVEYEVEAELDGARVTLHFHRACYDVWKTGNDQA